MLGRFPGYLQKGKDYAAKTFTAKGEWTWEENKQFLDKAIERGENFLLETPFAKGMENKSVYRDELIYVIQRNYELVTLHGQEWLIPIH